MWIECLSIICVRNKKPPALFRPLHDRQLSSTVFVRMNHKKARDLQETTSEQVQTQRSLWQKQKSQKARIGLEALRRCLAGNQNTEFVIRFTPTRKPVRTKDRSTLSGAEDLPEVDGEPDSAWNLSNSSSAHFVAIAAEIRRLKESLGRVSIYNTEGNHLFSATIRYRMFVELVYGHNVYWPLRPEKDDKFTRAMTKKRRDFAPFLMIVSNNGHDVTALKELRKKFPKFKPEENT